VVGVDAALAAVNLKRGVNASTRQEGGDDVPQHLPLTTTEGCTRKPWHQSRWRGTRPEGNGHLLSSTFGERRTLALDHDCLRMPSQLHQPAFRRFVGIGMCGGDRLGVCERTLAMKSASYRARVACAHPWCECELIPM
jgi:hypothetical protein